METKTKKHYFAPDSQILAMQPVRILDNSLTNYKYGDLDDVPAPFEMPSFESLLNME